MGYYRYRLACQTVNICREASLACVVVQRYFCRIAFCPIRPRNWFLCPQNWANERYDYCTIFSKNYLFYFSCCCNPSIHEGHNTKTGDLFRQAPHIVHSLLPKCEDEVVRESYRRTGVVTPAQVHGEFMDLVDKEPNGKF